MRTVLSLIAGLLLVSVTNLSAQQAPPIEPGSRVRITAPDQAMHQEVVTLEAWRGDTLVIGRPWTFRCPLASVTRLDVSRGRNALKGLLIGAMVGAPICAAVLFVGSQDPGDPNSLCYEGAAGCAARGALVCGAAGGLVGLGIGALSERWKEVPLDQLRLSFVARRDGRLSFGVSVEF